MCHGEGVINNPPSFYNPGETPEVGINCDSCKGTGQVEVNNAEGTRVAMLVAKRIVSEYPHLKSWEPIYEAIVANISNAVNFSTSTARANHQHVPEPVFSLDEVFSEETLPIDAYLNQMIDKKPFFMDEAKLLLGLKD
jgi:hypothetical protein